MSKKNKSKNNSGYIFTGSAANSSNNKQKKINKSQAVSGTTVEKTKKHLNILGGNENKPKKEHMNPFGIDAALTTAIKHDRKYIRCEGRRVEHAVKREAAMNNIKSNGGLKASIGNVFHSASAAVSAKVENHKARVEKRETTLIKARKLARGVYDEAYGSTKAEKAVQF